ncbi:hypothetical protein [Halocynthiibacter namhaensis]|uniref:hypothetical protein n=1 Tax=Halocynthiibacter namhaensis TaxID=1290553 RepID=UPI0005791E6E|nr:hypothetical protein [Halocynthiibacter namhaensis]
MTKKVEVHLEAERYIHNVLSGCSFTLQNRMNDQFESAETTGVYHTMMACLVFVAFTVEARVNFIGQKVFGEGWPEKANLEEKIELLNVHLGIGLCRGDRPLQTILKLKKLRNTLAHGKPEIVSRVEKHDEEPDVFGALRFTWEEAVNKDFVMRCDMDEKRLWSMLLEAAGIDEAEAITHGGYSVLNKYVEGTD